jgi:L-threonylcarbamoyladenylate synthase
MITRLINSEDRLEMLKETKSLLSEGEIIVFPTETVYGLGGDIFNEDAVEKIFIAKNRVYTNPLAAHIGNLDQINGLWTEIPDDFYKLAEKFLPGPLSIIYKKSKKISNKVTAGFDSLAVRFPDNKACIDIISNFGFPLAATSANLSGKPSPINVSNVLEDLDTRIPLIIDDGQVTYGMESTVISLVDESPIIFRTGIISIEEIESVLNKNIIVKDNSNKSQYAPNTIIYEFNTENDINTFIEMNFLSNFVVLSNKKIEKYNLRDLRTETLYNEFRKADKDKLDALLILYDEKMEQRLIREKIKLAVNQQKMRVK